MVIKMINKLIQFDLDEKLFREYYYLEKTAKNIQDFKLKYQDDAYNLNIALNPEILQTRSLEEDYFEKNQDIIILKHPRYIPFFIHDHDYFEIIYILKGNAIQIIENKVVELQAGHLFLLAPQIKHGIKVFNDEFSFKVKECEYHPINVLESIELVRSFIEEHKTILKMFEFSGDGEYE